MGSDGFVLLRGDNPDAPLVLSLSDYFPDTAAELEAIRTALLAKFSLAQLASLHSDARGVLVFDPMVAEEQGAESYDEIAAACDEAGYGAIWFDPARPIAEQGIKFDERESIEVTPDMIEEIVSSKKKKNAKKPVATAKKRVAKAKAKKPTLKAKAKKPAARAKAKPAKKKPAAKARAKRR